MRVVLWTIIVLAVGAVAASDLLALVNSPLPSFGDAALVVWDIGVFALGINRLSHAISLWVAERLEGEEHEQAGNTKRLHRRS